MDRKAQLEKFLQESPDDAFLNYAMAQEYIALNDIENAKKIFDKLLTMHPNYVASYYHLGKILEKQNEKNKAIEIYKTGIQIAKQNKETHAQSELQSALLELEMEDLL